MKKVHNLSMCIFLIAISFAVSCTKQSAPLGSGTTPTPGGDPTPGLSQIGSVVDLGLVNADTRVMSTLLQTQSFVIGNADGSVVGSTANVSLKYYVGQDAQIPEGQYVYSNSDAKVNYTFDSATISGAVDSTGYSLPPENIIEGSVVVTQTGSGGYGFSISGTLESGRSFTGHTQGAISYIDNEVY